MTSWGHRNPACLGVVTVAWLLPAIVAGASEVPFEPRPSISSGLSAPVDARLADLDGDGDLDVVFASRDSNLVGWLDQNGGVFTQRTIETLTSPTSVFEADLDRDGDLDVVATSDSQDRVRWYESDGGSPPTFTAHDVSTEADGAEEVFAADVNRDGRLDLVSVAKNDDEIAWYANDGASPPAFTRSVIDEDPDAAGSGANGFVDSPVGIVVFDPDRDGDPDVAVIGDSMLAWFENTNGLGTSWSPHTLAAGFPTGTQVAAADADRDGDPDLVVAIRNDDSVRWYENDGTATGWPGHLVSNAVDFGTGGNVSVGDVDGDGDVDVVAGSGPLSKLFWFENNGSFGFNTHEIVGQLPIEHPAVGDLDGDGDADLVALNPSDGQLRWIKNRTIHRSATFPLKGTISADDDVPSWVSAADLDRDGDLDALEITVGATGGIRWRANTNGLGAFGPANLVATAIQGRVIRVADMDRDGDPDVVTAATAGTPGLAWHENTAGDASAWTTRTISATYPSPFHADVGDIDADGDLDVLASSSTGSSLAWFENTAGNASAWSQHAIAATQAYPSAVRLADVDGDGDLDAFYTELGYATVAWKENTAGDGSAWSDHIIENGGATTAPNTVEPVDLDHDGDVDVVVASKDSTSSAWFENANGSGTSWTRHAFGATAKIEWLRVADLDADGDVDVVGAAPEADDLFVFENVSGDGTTWSIKALAANLDGAHGVEAADLDGDGDVDLLGVGLDDGDLIELVNRGGQFALPTTVTAYKGILDGHRNDVLAIDYANRGRAGDTQTKLTQLVVELDNAAGGTLSVAQANALFVGISIFADTGSGAFEFGTDTFVGSVSAPFSSPIPTITLNGGGLLLAPGATQRLFVVPLLTGVASSSGTSQFQIKHRLAGSIALDANFPTFGLAREYAADVTSGVVQALPISGDADADGLTNSNEADAQGTDPLNVDTDADGLEDGAEVNTWSSNPLLNDTDGDGLLDGAEVTAYGTSPTDTDSEDDGYCDGPVAASGCTPGDNCPGIANAAQTNSDAAGAGDVCQCGNVDGIGGITSADYQLAREAVVKTPSGSFDPSFCDVDGDSVCSVADLAILQRIVNAQPASVLDACPGYRGQ